MPHLPDLADRVWFAIHCLPRDKRGKPPSYRQLEKDFGLAPASLSKAVLGKARHQWSDTRRALCAALQVSEPWLEFGAGAGPTPTGIVPPRPGWKLVRHGDLRGWDEAVRIALREPTQQVPVAAFRAGAALTVYEPVSPEHITPQFVVGVAHHAWVLLSPSEQEMLDTLDAKHASAGDASPRLRTARRSSEST
jgi:hypothetical protein